MKAQPSIDALQIKRRLEYLNESRGRNLPNCVLEFEEILKDRANMGSVFDMVNSEKDLNRLRLMKVIKGSPIE